MLPFNVFNEKITEFGDIAAFSKLRDVNIINSAVAVMECQIQRMSGKPLSGLKTCDSDENVFKAKKSAYSKKNTSKIYDKVFGIFYAMSHKKLK